MSKATVVACGVLSHGIYAKHIINNAIDDSSTCNVTRMAIEAVRDYMVDDMKSGNSVGYSWNRGDGKVVKLICIVEDAK